MDIDYGKFHLPVIDNVNRSTMNQMKNPPDFPNLDHRFDKSDRFHYRQVTQIREWQKRVAKISDLQISASQKCPSWGVPPERPFYPLFGHFDKYFSATKF